MLLIETFRLCLQCLNILHLCIKLAHLAIINTDQFNAHNDHKNKMLLQNMKYTNM